MSYNNLMCALECVSACAAEALGPALCAGAHSEGWDLSFVLMMVQPALISTVSLTLSHLPA